MSKVKEKIVDLSKTTQVKIKPIKKSNHIHFSDHPDFKPNLSPKEVLQKGSFGGTYYRPIYSQVVEKQLKNQHQEYPDSWFEGLDVPKQITSPTYDKSVNTYNIKCGQSLLDWEKSGWISNLDPYGWFQWYCRFYLGRRHPQEDARQIQRWKNLTGEKGRHRNSLISQIHKARINSDISIHDKSISPRRRQSLQHWGYKLTKKDYDERIDFLGL
jgi:hypothetical protein